ncbi:hypothetical protein LINGRAHAP2_LOCUS4109, partial [Linum grandiflorum]
NAYCGATAIDIELGTYSPTSELGFYHSPQLSYGQPERNCALERTLPALSARSRIAPVRETCSLHSRSASDHD